MLAPGELEVGVTYRVVTVSGRFIGRYMGKDYADRLLFDLRPESGTTTVAREDIKMLDIVPPR